VVRPRRGFAVTALVDNDEPLVRCEVLELCDPNTACTAKGVDKDKRRGAIVDVGVHPSPRY